MIYVGGLRARLIHESIYREVHSALDALGWFDPDRQHSPVQFLSTGVHDPENVTVNTAALADWDMFENENELGSQQSEMRMAYYIDFYAENDAIGKHFSYDVKDILTGRMPSIGRGQPNIPVYDYSVATPDLLFYVQVENTFIDRPSVFERPWMRYFRTVAFEILDVYSREDQS